MPSEDLDSAMVQEIQRESSGFTPDVLKNPLRPQDAVETTPGLGETSTSCLTLLPATPPAVYPILM